VGRHEVDSEATENCINKNKPSTSAKKFSFPTAEIEIKTVKQGLVVGHTELMGGEW